jgi:hypothetical protein
MVGMLVSRLDALGELDLVARPDRDLLQRRHAAARHVDEVAARFSSSGRSATLCSRSQPPSTQSVAEMRMPTTISGDRRAHRLEHLEREAHAVLERAAVVVVALFASGDRNWCSR